MRSSSKGKKGIGCLVVIGLLLLGGLVQSVVRYLGDKPLYAEAHAAYLAGDCETAIPIFEKISNSLHFIDFGKFKDQSQNELRDCSTYMRFIEKGLNGLYEFVQYYPDSPLLTFAQIEANDIFKNLNLFSDLETELGEENCIRANELKRAGFLTDEGAITRYMFYCAVLQSQHGRMDESYFHLKTLMRDYPDSEMAHDLLRFMQTYTTFCSMLNLMEENPAFNRNLDSMAEYYLACVESNKTWNEYGYGYADAIIIYEAFLEKFPDHPARSDVEKALAEAMILQARETGSGVIERPDPSGSAPSDIARVVIQNDSPHELKIIFSGPETLIEQLPACPECKDYSITGPLYCPEMGPIGTYELPPGTYEVLVETVIDEDIVPFTGTWDLIGGNEFYTCFFVVTSIY